MIFDSLQEKEVVELLKRNKIAVLPTDTIYGLVGTALSPRIVEDIYDIRERDRKKPMIVLVASESQLRTFFELEVPRKISALWPAKLSVVLECSKYPHIHRGGGTIAFRIPERRDLRNLIDEVGPIVAPSANPEGKKPAVTIDKAFDYFGERVDFYVDEGKMESDPSTLISYLNGEIQVLREGAVNPESLR